MRTVCLVHKYLHAVRVRQIRNRAEIGADAVIGWIVDKDRLGVRMSLNRCGDILHTHTERNAKHIVDAGIHIDRDGAAENQSVDGTPVDVPRHDDFIPAPYCREHHCLHGSRGAAHHEECVCSAKRLCSELFRIPNHRNRMAEIIEHFHGVHVDIEAGVSEECRELRIPAPALMSRHIKGNKTCTLHPLKSLLNGSTRLREIRHYFASERSLETRSS